MNTYLNSQDYLGSPRRQSPCQWRWSRSYPNRYRATPDLEWVEASGEGEIYATTATSRRVEQGGDYNISLVTLKEGPRMMARVVGIDPHEVKIGMAVTADIQEVEGTRAIVFQPAKGA